MLIVRLSLPRMRAERRGLRLWKIWIALLLAFITAIAIAAGVFYAGWGLLGARGLKPEPRIDAKTLFDLVKLSFGVVAGAGALVALVVAYRRQRLDEDGALRDDTRLHSERFTTAVSQLGDEAVAVRLGGVHALAGLADDAPTRGLRQTCIDVLCAYLRLPYTPETELPTGATEARHTYLALREVRHTIIRLIRDHLRLDSGDQYSWQGHDFDFTGVVFDGGDFTDAVFSGGTVTFSEAAFAGGTVTFWGAMFSGATVSFDDVLLSGGWVTFHDAAFASGTVDFSQAAFDSGMVDFAHAAFTGATVSFEGTYFGATIDFTQAAFSAGAVTFNRALFHEGAVTFHEAAFTGAMVDFDNAMFADSTGDVRSAVFLDGRVTSGEPPVSRS